MNVMTGPEASEGASTHPAVLAFVGGVIVGVRPGDARLENDVGALVEPFRDNLPPPVAHAPVSRVSSKEKRRRNRRSQSANGTREGRE